jgi:hypothetical protein
MTTLASGQILPAELKFQPPQVQNIEGSALEAASKTTLDANAKLAATAKSMGAGQKGGMRRKTRRGGADNLNAHPPMLPEAGSIKGVSSMGVHLQNINNQRQISTDAVGDKLMNAQPYDPTPTKGGRRTKRNRKAKNGRRNNRTHRRRHSKSSSRGGRSSRSVHRHMAKSK